jgi:D-glycero-alpha-D-manno-heptose-7-phosphate kinase
MKNALLLGRVHDVGRLLDEGWKLKKDFSDSVSNENIDSLYDLAKNNGAVGGKLLGAGGGGHMILMCEASRKQELSRVICKAGAVITDFAFEYNGLHTWKAKLK